MSVAQDAMDQYTVPVGLNLYEVYDNQGNYVGTFGPATARSMALSYYRQANR
jgi:hypothetical protein